MKRSLISALLVAFILSLIPTPVLADGALFIGDELMWHDLYQSGQKALILHGNSAGNSTGNMTQHLVLSVSFRGDAEDFAWVVPVPSIPAIDVTDADVFAELSDFTIKAIPRDPGRPGFLCMHVGDSPPSNGVDVIDEQVVGPYATATLSAEDPNALVDWLNDNGYFFPEEGEKVIAEYIERGWYFVATRINAVDEGTGKALAEGAIDPIVLSFASDDIVYPLRITSLSATAPEVLLYIIADHVMVPEQYPWHVRYGPWWENEFSLEFADKVSLDDLSAYDVLPGLISTYLAGDDFYLTKLRGKVTADEMVDIDFAPYYDAASLQWPSRTDTMSDGIAVLAIIFVPVMGLYLWRRHHRRM